MNALIWFCVGAIVGAFFHFVVTMRIIYRTENLEVKLDRVRELADEFDSYRPDTAKRIRAALGDEE